MGKVATSPLPSRGSPPLRSGGQNQKWPTCGQSGYVSPCRLGDPHRCRARGQNQKWPTCGQSGYVTPAISGIPTAAERGKEIRSGPLMGNMATSPLPSRGSPPLRRRGAKSEVAHLWARWLRHPCRLRDPHRFRAGGKIRSGPLMGKVATSPLPSRGSPPLQGGEQNQKWPTCGQGGYVTPTVSGIPTAAERGGNHKWPTCGQRGYVTLAVSGIPTASERGGKIRSGPVVGKVATSPLPSRGSPPLQSGGRGNQKWPTYGQSGYVTPAVSGIPTASERGGGGSEVAHLWAKWLRHPCRLGDAHRCRAGGSKSEVAHLWAKWLRHPCRLGDPHRCRAGEGNQKWPTYGRHGYVTPAVSGIPTASEAGGKIRSGPLMGKVATSPLPSPRSPPLQSGGQNQKWPTYGQSGYVTPAISGIPTASGRGTKSEVAHLWARWLRHPYRLGDPHRCRAGGKSQVAHLWATWLRHPCRLGDPHRFRAGGQNQKWPSCRQSGYVTPSVSGIPTAAERGGGGSEVAHLWAKWLRHPCRLRDPHRFRAGGGGGIRSGPLMGKVATSPLPSRGSPPLQSGGVKIRSGPLVGNVATSPLPSQGSPPLLSGGAKSEVAQL